MKLSLFSVVVAAAAGIAADGQPPQHKHGGCQQVTVTHTNVNYITIRPTYYETVSDNGCCSTENGDHHHDSVIPQPNPVPNSSEQPRPGPNSSGQPGPHSSKQPGPEPGPSSGSHGHSSHDETHSNQPVPTSETHSIIKSGNLTTTSGIVSSSNLVESPSSSGSSSVISSFKSTHSTTTSTTSKSTDSSPTTSTSSTPSSSSSVASSAESSTPSTSSTPSSSSSLASSAESSTPSSSSSIIPPAQSSFLATAIIDGPSFSTTSKSSSSSSSPAPTSSSTSPTPTTTATSTATSAPSGCPSVDEVCTKEGDMQCGGTGFWECYEGHWGWKECAPPLVCDQLLFEQGISGCNWYDSNNGSEGDDPECHNRDEGKAIEIVGVPRGFPKTKPPKPVHTPTGSAR